jgi:hypothetical protein
MMAIYAVMVLLSACLLFLVQPLIPKIILPWFGRTSSVWSAALVFFQVCLLAGYGYGHLLTTYLRACSQAIIHCSLLLLACLLMPILPDEAWRTATGRDPTLAILMLLTASVGLPSFLLSATSPLLQVWYLRAIGGEPPYWLFALSNFGSLVALMSSPILLEPSFGASRLAYDWSGLFVAFAVLCICIAWMTRRGETTAPVATGDPGAAPSAMQMACWILLSACGSALRVAVSTQLSTNVAPIPLLWVVPTHLEKYCRQMTETPQG